MPGCAAIGCNNRSEKGYTMKNFPRDQKLRKIWTDRVCRADWEPSKNSFLCHVHFEADQWTLTQSGRIKLKKNAVPSIFTITSTRKSPRKRRKLDDEDLYIVEYLEEPKDCNSLVKAKNLSVNHYTRKNVISRIGRPVYTRSSCRTATKIVMRDHQQVDTIVISDDNTGLSVNSNRKNGVVLDNEHDRKVAEIMNSSSKKLKTEMKSQIDSDRDLIDIEKTLRSICEGVSESDETNAVNDKNDGEITDSRKSSIDEKYSSSRHSSTRENGKSINRKKRTREEIMRHEEKAIGALNSKTNGVIGEKENVQKSCMDMDTLRRSTFTIKLTGNEDDVTEIVEGLGTESILKYKSSNEFSNSSKNIVTSVISVTDHSSPTLKSREAESKLNHKNVNSSSNDINQTTTIINGNRQNVIKLYANSSEEDKDLTIVQRLRKKVKFQEIMIFKLTSQLEDKKEKVDVTTSPKSQSKKRKIAPDFHNEDRQDDGKDIMIKELLARLNKSDETCKHFNESLIQEEAKVTKFQSQLRQRDNRINELNWKLIKASKLIERAEKNTNIYRKKLASMQTFITRMKNREEQERDMVILLPPVNMETSMVHGESLEKSITTNINTEKSIEPRKSIEKSITPVKNGEKAITSAKNNEKLITSGTNTEKSIIAPIKKEISTRPTVKMEKSIAPTIKMEPTIIPMIKMEKPLIPTIKMERRILSEEEPMNSFDFSQTNKWEEKDQNTGDNSIIYRTVQDIFDEGNDYDDDDINIIDNPEDFMRQFAGSL